MSVPVIRSDAHLAHDGLIEIERGQPIPCWDAPARVVEIERALRATGDYRFEEPDEHGDGPILAVHDPALLDVLSTAWEEAWTAGLTDGTEPLIPGTFLTTAYAAGHQTGVPGPGHRVFAYTFDTATPLDQTLFSYLSSRQRLSRVR